MWFLQAYVEKGQGAASRVTLTSFGTFETPRPWRQMKETERREKCVGEACVCVCVCVCVLPAPVNSLEACVGGVCICRSLSP